MKRLNIILAAASLCAALSSASAREGATDAFVEQLQKRDSILIADQLRYGAALPGIPSGALIQLPQLKDTLCAYIDIVKGWKLDTVKVHKRDNVMDLEASMVITSFDEGEYLLPGFPVAVHMPDGSVDTLHFKGQDVLFCTMPVDTATFKIHDIKPQKRYPLTFMEVLPWLGGVLALAAIVAAVVWYVRKRRREKAAAEHRDPPHIVALRKLDAYRGDKFWAPQKQKLFYSGVTDALREYMSARYGIGAMEMTTAEIFTSLRGSDIPQDLKDDLKELFERADFVKFAKHVATDEENAGVLPLSVRFVTSTYQEDIKEENGNVL